jgi:hypothetical protein
MYYHPAILPTSIDSARVLNMCRAVAGVWLDGAERHHAVQLDAWKDLCSARLEGTRALSAARLGPEIALRAFFAASSEPFTALAVAASWAANALDTHRRTIEALYADTEAGIVPVAESRTGRGARPTSSRS